jgi:hypothetical protein
MSNYSECLTSAAVDYQIIILGGGRLRPESVAGIERNMQCVKNEDLTPLFFALGEN